MNTTLSTFTKTFFMTFCICAIISCKEKDNGARMINTGLRDITLLNKEAENDFNKGLFYVRYGNYSAAKDFFMRADDESPNTPVILNGVGNCLDRCGEALEGFKYYKKALRIDSNYIETYANYGASLNNSGRFEEAEAIFRIGLRKKSPPSFDRSRLYFNLAYTYNGRGQWDSALSVLDSAKIGLKDQNILDGIKQMENHVKMSALTGNGVDTDGRR
jgi:tetratricopeptide (TPR) repeat protein